ncbi:MAG: hypothetical protein ACP5N2_00940 [Candidatus Nanoarchaeia archaeon]
MFVEINGRILDEREYKREVLLLKRLIECECSEVISKYGFKIRKNVFVHENTGLKIKLLFEKSEQKPL